MQNEVQTTLREEDKINLEAVYKELTKVSLFRRAKVTALLTNFANLIAAKSSFAHKVHKTFNRSANLPDNRSFVD